VADAIQALVARIPAVNAAMLHQLVRLLYIISLNQPVNRMDGSNLAKVIGPNILGSKDATACLQGINAINSVLARVIDSYPLIFERGKIWEQRWDDCLEPTSAHPVCTRTPINCELVEPNGQEVCM
jgi:hypothetical protein